MRPHLLIAAALLAGPVLPGIGAAEAEKEKAPPAKEPELQRLVVDPIYSLKEVEQMPVATSQPFVCLLPSQSVKPAAHEPLQRPAPQVRVAMLFELQTVPQPPQKQVFLAWAGQRVVLEHDWRIPAGDDPFGGLAAGILPLLEPEMSETRRLIETETLARALMGYATGDPARLGAHGAPLIVYDPFDGAHHVNVVRRALQEFA